MVESPHDTVFAFGSSRGSEEYEALCLEVLPSLVTVN
jgi:hypothetical protein